MLSRFILLLPRRLVPGQSWFQPKSKPSEHDERVTRVRSEVRSYARAREAGEAWAQKLLRTDRKGAASLNVRMSDKSGSQTVNMSDLTNILGVDEQRGVIKGAAAKKILRTSALPEAST